MHQEHSMHHRPGRLAPRLIQDVLDATIRDFQDCDQEDEDLNLLFRPCQQLRQPLAHLSVPEDSNAHTGHNLLSKPPQTQENSPPDASTISCICVLCRHHFVFRVSPGRHPLGKSEQDGHLLHHYVRVKVERFEDVGVEESSTFKHYPLVSKAQYECSVCGHGVVVEMSVPRLPTKWIDLVTDEQRIRNKIEAAKQEDPERFEGVRESLKTDALITLNAYLRNLTANGATEAKRILFRNKIFHLQFGDDAKPLFTYLDFTYSRNEDGEEMWITPVLDPQTRTPLASRRAFYEDVRSEIQSVIAGYGDLLQHTSILIDNLPARHVLERVLECGDNKYRRSTGADPSDINDHLGTLGITADSDPPLLQWAHACQVRVDPSRQKAYFDALEGLFKSGTQSRRTEALETYFTTEWSKQSLPVVRTPLAQALQYFNLRVDCDEADSYILGVYRTFAEQSPAQKHKHRLMLQQLGSGRSSQEILDVVYNEPMSIKEAYSLLNAEESYVMSGIAVMAQQEIDNAKTDPRLVLMALETVAQSKPATGVDDAEREEFDQVLAGIRSRVADGGINHDSATSGPDLDLPVGLENLRNTCYLNSILQYFFSVTAVRELALRCSSQPSLPSTQEAVTDALERLDLPKLRPGRAFLANHFAHELGALFEQLGISPKTCVKPTQRLANAALMRSFRVRSRLEDMISSEGAPAKDVPPLPPRSNAKTASPMVTVNPGQETCETASDVSSQTLVNQPDDERSYVVIDHATARADEVVPVDVEMSDGHAVAPAGTEPSLDSDLTVEELAKELDQPNVGSDQMDIDEVMGNMIDLLEAAEEVSRAMEAQDTTANSIRRSFFSANVDHRKNVGSAWTTIQRSDRWAVAYPAAKGSRELYDALEPTFGLEQTDTEKLLYLTIDVPAPNFHIYIQRTSLVSKNLNLVRIPETIYLDRYMETDRQSSLFGRRKRAWNINARLMEIEEQLSTATKHGQPITIPDLDEETASPEDDDAEWSMVDMTMVDDLATIYGQPKARVAPVEVEAEAETQAISLTGRGDHQLEGVETEDDLIKEKSTLMEERKELFAKLQNVKYRLHAVLCHVGTTGRAGHYWAWVRDFEQGVWRKYNDTTVTVDSAEHVLQHLNTTEKGEPYYVAYVRESDIGELVRIPRREVEAAQEAEPPRGSPHVSPDVDMHEARDVSGERVEGVLPDLPQH